MCIDDGDDSEGGDDDGEDDDDPSDLSHGCFFFSSFCRVGYRMTC